MSNEITLELFEDCGDFTAEKELNALSQGEGASLAWQLKVNGKEVGELETYPSILRKLDMLFDLENADLIIINQKDNE